LVRAFFPLGLVQGRDALCEVIHELEVDLGFNPGFLDSKFLTSSLDYVPSGSGYLQTKISLKYLPQIRISVLEVLRACQRVWGKKKKTSRKLQSALFYSGTALAHFQSPPSTLLNKYSKLIARGKDSPAIPKTHHKP
jgi:hypothetical protein